MTYQIGFYKDVITPPIGTYLAGYAARTHGSEGIHDHLYTRALYLGSDDQHIVLVSSDVLGIDRNLREDIVKIVKGRVDIPEENIVLSATHTHSGPVLRGYFSEASEEYLKILSRKVAGVIIAAYKNRKKLLRVSYSEGYARETIVNRRDPYKGPVDPRIHVIEFKSEDGSIIAFLNFTCHAVVLGSNNYLISADYPGAFMKWYEKATGHTSTFFNGACANINPYTPGTDLEKVYDRNVGTFDDVEWMGSILAFEAAKHSRLAEYKRVETLKFKSCTEKLRRIDIPPLDILEERFQEAKRKLEENDTLENRWNYYMARNSYLLAKRLARRKFITVRLSAFSINDIVTLFLPSEVFVEHQLYIKEKSPFSKTLVIAYSDDYFGYIPTKKAYDEGGYETRYPVTILSKGSGEKLRKRALKLIKEFK